MNFKEKKEFEEKKQREQEIKASSIDAFNNYISAYRKDQKSFLSERDKKELMGLSIELIDKLIGVAILINLWQTNFKLADPVRRLRVNSIWAMIIFSVLWLIWKFTGYIVIHPLWVLNFFIVSFSFFIMSFVMRFDLRRFWEKFKKGNNNEKV